MRNPYTLNDVVVDSSTIIKIDALPEYDIQDWDLFDPKDFSKYITTVERIIRNSFEYRQMVKYLRENFNMNACSFYNNVSNENSRRIKIHIHHDPITLYDMCIIVYNKRMFYHEDMSEEMLAKEVMFLHYNLYVGLIPLAETVHTLVHNRYLFVPTTKVFGNYKKFLEEYRDFMLPDQIENIEKIEEYTKTYDTSDYKKVLDKNFIYVDMSGVTELPKYEDIVNILNNRVIEIRESRSKNDNQT